ncbi:hypothetical protein WJX79_000091 [Trebouxia sp. C0005]
MRWRYLCSNQGSCGLGPGTSGFQGARVREVAGEYYEQQETLLLVFAPAGSGPRFLLDLQAQTAKPKPTHHGRERGSRKVGTFWDASRPLIKAPHEPHHSGLHHFIQHEGKAQVCREQISVLFIIVDITHLLQAVA